MGQLSVLGLYGLDTETTGLRKKDRLFSIILADENQGYYFSFNETPDHLGHFVPEEYRLPREWIIRMRPIFENPESTFFIHNAKFDLRMLAKDGIGVRGAVHCTEAVARVLKNTYPRYKLADCAKRIGLAKDEAVDAYIKKHKLVTKTPIPGKDKPEERKHFDRVPFPIMAQYASTDAVLHRKLGMYQCEELSKIDRDAPEHMPKIMPLVLNERRLTKVLHRVEETGIRINRSYTQGALAYTQQLATRAMQSFEELTGIPYEDSATTLVEAFNKFGVVLPKTPTGKPCTKKEVLEALENPVADKIREIRGHQKLASTYYSSFLYFADEEDIVRGNLRQGGTETSRFSHSDPNLANLPKEDDEEDRHKQYLVRRSFIPLDSDWCLVPIDFKQQEFRMMLDYAGEQEMIALIMGGMDVHDATAQMLGITRKQAKTINFGLLYGMGAAKLAKALGVEIQEAYRLRDLYFSKLPRVRRFIRQVLETGQERGYIRNWYGFRNHLPMNDAKFAYVLPNHLIQGGCAQVLRRAMVDIDEFIERNGYKTRMLTCVHDEILFQVHRTEFHIVPELQRIMEGIYRPKNGLYLHCSVEHSWKSWGKWDMVKGYPDVATR